MGLDDMENQAELQELRLRIERLEQEVAALRHLQLESPVAAPPPPVRHTEAIASAPVLPSLSAPEPPPRQSIENRLGSQWFSRIGIIALLIATALLLKIAFDNHWIGPLGRILAGLVAGSAIIIWSERFRRQGVATFSYALKAIGSGVLYLTLWAAFQLYGLMPAAIAFGAMLLVTAWNAYMAWSQDAELLAAYALIGAFATPALLSNGHDQELFLFSYLAVINLAVVVLVRLKPWPRLLVAAFVPTVGYYVAWDLSSSANTSAFWMTTVFLAIFFLIFMSASIGRREEDEAGVRSSLIQDVLLPLGNAVFTALALYGLLNPAERLIWPTWIAVLLAAIYLGLVRISRSETACAVHLSLAILFLTIAIPLKATGHGIVIGWLVEGAALLGASAHLPRESASMQVRQVLRWLACAALALGFVAVVATPTWFTARLPFEAFLNWRFATGMIGSAAFASAIYFALYADDVDDARPRWLPIAAIASIAFNLITVWSFVQEIATFWRTDAGNADASLQKDLATSAFLALYGALLLAVGFRTRRAFVRWQALILLVFTIAKTFLYDMHSLSLGYRAISLLGLGALLMAVSFAYQKDLLGLREPAPPSEGGA
jgi:uncharacterized membrane protein